MVLCGFGSPTIFVDQTDMYFGGTDRFAADPWNPCNRES